MNDPDRHNMSTLNNPNIKTNSSKYVDTIGGIEIEPGEQVPPNFRSCVLYLMPYILCLASCILLFVFPAYADVDMQVLPGFDGYHKNERWVPLRIVLTSVDEENIEGTVAVEIQDNTSENRQIYSTPVTLFKAARKVQYLYALPGSFRRNLQVTLMDNHGKELLRKDAALTHISPEALMMAVITNSGGGLEFLTDTSKPDASPGKIHISYSTAELLPDKWKGYDSVDTILLGDVSADAFSVQQQRAITDWVYGGGNLIVSGGSHSQDLVGSFIEKLLPVRIAGTRVLDSISSLSSQFDGDLGRQPMVVASSELTNGGKAIAAESDGLPMIAEIEVGDGRVVFLAFDYLDPAFRTWAGKKEMWQRLLSKPTPDKRPINVRLLSAVSSARVSSYKFIGPFLLLYALCFGPLNYLVLKKSNRSKWAWVAMTVVAGIFTIGALGFTYMTRERATVINDLSVVDVYQDVGRARIKSHFGLFSHTKSDSRMEFPASEAVFVNRISPRESETHQDGDFRLVENDVFIMEILHMKTLSRQFFYGESYVNLDGSIEVNAPGSHAGTGLGEVSNKLPLDFTDCYVFSNGRNAYVGDLKSGTRAQFGLERASYESISDLYPSIDIEGRRFIVRRWSSLQSPEKGLVGWIDGSALEKLAGMRMAKKHRTSGMALVIIRL